MRFKNPTEEEIEIDERMTAHEDALKFEHFVFKVSALLYLGGFTLLIFGSDWLERIGMAVVITAVVAFFYHFILHIGTLKKARAVAEVMMPYLKRKSLPLVQDLREKLADDPNTRFVHNDDGSVTVIRKKEGES